MSIESKPGIFLLHRLEDQVPWAVWEGPCTSASTQNSVRSDLE